jgi:hypothetical protein
MGYTNFMRSNCDLNFEISRERLDKINLTGYYLSQIMAVFLPDGLKPPPPSAREI